MVNQKDIKCGLTNGPSCSGSGCKNLLCIFVETKKPGYQVFKKILNSKIAPGMGNTIMSWFKIILFLTQIYQILFLTQIYQLFL